MPNFRLERSAGGIVAGIDEAGRGPWAGPVVAAAVILQADRLPRRFLSAIDDSKVLSADRRQDVFAKLMAARTKHLAWIGVGAASVGEIDRLNILEATMLAMRRALLRLPMCPSLALVDGNRAPSLPCAVRTVVDGDASSVSIAAASIVAKVIRDRLMARLALRYPGFGWEHNAGYGTREHAGALRQQGPCAHHRASFAPIRALLTG